MTKFYQDYFWKNGLPIGIKQAIDAANGITYKLVSDPYYKRNSIEQYKDGKFSEIIYDSALLDFRSLKPANQMAWQKSYEEETDQKVICHIRNQDDRLILIEEYLYEKGRCYSCKTFAPQGPLLSFQHIFYQSPTTDSATHQKFHGVILFDCNHHPVLKKTYDLDLSGEFSNLLEEQWDMQNAH